MGIDAVDDALEGSGGGFGKGIESARGRVGARLAGVAVGLGRGGRGQTGESVEEGGFAFGRRRGERRDVDGEGGKLDAWERIVEFLMQLDDFGSGSSESEVVGRSCRCARESSGVLLFGFQAVFFSKMKR